MSLSAELLELEEKGRLWVRGALSIRDLDTFDRVCNVAGAPGRRMNTISELSSILGKGSRMAFLVDQVLPNARPVRSVIFNKSKDLNWQVAWHQDRVVAVKEKHDVEGFRGWTKKVAVWHVEPQIEYLRGMVFARVHLDATDLENGCLELALGSHKNGFVKAEEAANLANEALVECCEAQRGDILFVKALTLHRSQSSQTVSQRRTTAS